MKEGIMKSKCVWQGRSNGREGTTWTGSIRCLRKKIPNFSQIPFGIDKDSNKYMDIIVRQPISDVTVDLGYVEATTRERIPVAAVYNGYGADLYRSLKMYNSLKDIPSETLRAELRKRRYTLAAQQEKQTTGEIVKIG